MGETDQHPVRVLGAPDLWFVHDFRRARRKGRKVHPGLSKRRSGAGDRVTDDGDIRALLEQCFHFSVESGALGVGVIELRLQRLLRLIDGIRDKLQQLLDLVIGGGPGDELLRARDETLRSVRGLVDLRERFFNLPVRAAWNLVLLPRRWESGAVPELTGKDGQSAINHQLVDDADIIVGVFSQTLGSATPRAASGTAEELQRARDAGKPVHVYFSAMPIDRDHDREKLAALDEFKTSLQAIGLYGTFDTTGDPENKVRAAIEYDIAGLGLDSPAVRSAGGAELAGHYERDREPDRNGRMQTRRERIEIVNSGATAAEDVRMSLTSVEEGLSAPSLHGADTPFTVRAKGGRFTVPILAFAGTANHVRVDFSWTEDGKERTSSHSLALM